MSLLPTKCRLSEKGGGHRWGGCHKLPLSNKKISIFSLRWEVSPLANFTFEFSSLPNAFLGPQVHESIVVQWRWLFCVGSRARTRWQPNPVAALSTLSIWRAQRESRYVLWAINPMLSNLLTAQLWNAGRCSAFLRYRIFSNYSKFRFAYCSVLAI